MVGPWLFWLGPMIFGHISFSFLWHGIAFLFFWHCDGFPMMIIGGVPGTGFLGNWGESGKLDTYLASRWDGHDDEIYTMLSSMASRWTHCMLSAPM